MNRRDLAINGLLLLAILAVTALLVTYRPTQLEPPGRFLSAQATPEQPSRAETNPAPVGIAPLERYNTIQRVNIFRTIITPTPPPTPTPAPTPTPPPLNAVMSQFALIMMDPPNSVMVQNNTNKEMIDWKVGEKRKIKFQGMDLEVTLKSVDANEFRATFTAPSQPPFRFSYFGEAPK